MKPDIFDNARIPKPLVRPLKVYAFDPSAGRFVGNHMIAEVRYEALTPGPVGERFAVIDYDGGFKTYYDAVDLDDPRITIRGGLDPSESDPRFHQQMVYAVASETLQRFENALGRRVPWARFAPAKADGKAAKPDAAASARRLLYLFPHAMAQANAFYSRDAQGILFGYFRASQSNPGDNLPGQLVFTCLSHDIIAHETTHAIVDGIRSYFMEPTNIDVAAFHEAFADISALFCHFAHKDALLDTLQKTGGRLHQSQLRSDLPAGATGPQIQAEIAHNNPLIDLALQFGEASGMRGALRGALRTPPNSDDIKHKTEPHDRGAILVAAIFDAYFTIYTRRTSDLFRIYRAGGGSNDPIDLPQALAERLATEASRSAEEFFTICARALDYCPPVDIVFGDFLRALLTAHTDLYPADPDGVRNAFMEAFRLRGIAPDDASFFSEGALCWPQVAAGKLPPVTGLVFGDPNGLTDEEKDINGAVLRAYAKANAAALGFATGHGPIDASSFHPMFRIGPHGDLIIDMVVELVETTTVTDPDLGQYPFRSGATLLIWQERLRKGERPDPNIHYVIAKHRSAERQHRQKTYFTTMPGAHSHGGRAKGDKARWKIDFALMHMGL